VREGQRWQKQHGWERLSAKGGADQRSEKEPHTRMDRLGSGQRVKSLAAHARCLGRRDRLGVEDNGFLASELLVLLDSFLVLD